MDESKFEAMKGRALAWGSTKAVRKSDFKAKEKNGRPMKTYPIYQPKSTERNLLPVL